MLFISYTHVKGLKKSRAPHVSSSLPKKEKAFSFFSPQVREEWKKLKSDMVKQKQTDKGSKKVS